MICPFCGENNDKVLDSRASFSGYGIRRRRECRSCGQRFSTLEQIEGLEPTVVKKDGSRQPYSESKILRSLAVACSKRPVTPEQMNAIAGEAYDLVNNSYKHEITSNEIGELIMERLKTLDKVAYVRFASVYKDFTNPELFAEEVKKISDESGK